MSKYVTNAIPTLQDNQDKAAEQILIDPGLELQTDTSSILKHMAAETKVSDETIAKQIIDVVSEKDEMSKCLPLYSNIASVFENMSLELAQIQNKLEAPVEQPSTEIIHAISNHLHSEWALKVLPYLERKLSSWIQEFDRRDSIGSGI